MPSDGYTVLKMGTDLFSASRALLPTGLLFRIRTI